ncbi:hypothetical protein BDV18DRAFT_60007 [Aspergillus unguis]
MPIPTRSVPGRDPRKQETEPVSARSRLPSTATTTSTKLPATKSTDQTASKTAPSKTTSTSSSTIPTRRQSLVRPSQLKPPSSIKSTALPASTRTVGRGLASPVKKDDTARQTQSIRLPSPKKTDMPPPPRPTRSASLKQPAATSRTPTAPRGHVRHKSQVVTPASKSLHAPSSSISSTTPKSRTQFSTYQQHFSPKKTAKPPTPTPASAPADHGSLIPSTWPEIAALQTELLQLNLFHQIKGRRNEEWEREAEAQLRSKYDSVAGDYKAILNVEKETQREVNAQALYYWLGIAREHNGQQGFAEQVQLLSQVAQEVYGLSDGHGGRHTMVILEFERWLQKVEEIQEARGVDGSDGESFIEPISRKWREETAALKMKLELASRQLQSLDILGYGEVEALSSSALLRTVKSLDQMVTQMIQELKVVCRIEADIVKRETARVSELAQHLVDMRPRQDPSEPRTGLWTASFES